MNATGERSVRERVMAARATASRLAGLGSERSRLLRKLADALGDPHVRARLQEANRDDLAEANEALARGQLVAALVDRLHLGDAKLRGLSEGLRRLAEMPEVVGRVDLRRTLDDGLVLERQTCPLGLVGVVFEARPDALPQIVGLCLKSGNPVVLKGGHEARRSNAALVEIVHEVLRAHELPSECVVLLEDRAAFAELLALDDCVEMLVARGSSAFVERVRARTKIPVLAHAEGICHLYLHADADPEMAVRIAVDAKLGYPAACNSIETLLWHERSSAAAHACVTALRERGARLLGCPHSQAEFHTEVATELEYATEWSGPTLSLRRVADLDEALAHIARYGSRHTEAIVTGDAATAERFLAEVDAGNVFWNASTRFADGARYGLGGEVGISTAKLHARGPVGAEGLMTVRWLLRGTGQIAADYGPRAKAFLHRDEPIDNDP